MLNFVHIAKRHSSNPSRLSLQENQHIGSVVNELDMISTILLPPEDNIQDNLQQYRAMNNPYFTMKPSKDPQQYKFGSMLNNYQRVAGYENYRFVSERDMLSSQYSSVASVVAPEK